MTNKQYLTALEKLGLNIAGSAPRVLGISERQSQRLAAGHSRVPNPVAKLLQLMLRYKIDAAEVEAIT